jgi:hypothetical protein
MPFAGIAERDCVIVRRDIVLLAGDEYPRNPVELPRHHVLGLLEVGFGPYVKELSSEE